MAVPVSMKSTIADAIVARIATVAEVKTTSFDKIRLFVDDFREHEFPVVQIYDVSQDITHERGRILTNWYLALELLMKSSVTGTVDQKSLWDLQHKIERTLWEIPNLDIPGVVHLVYIGSNTDLHLLEPIYFARMDFAVRFYQPLVAEC